MNIDYELYRIFYEVANSENITRASQRLNISQPAISKSIKNLESQLGGELFIRTQKGVVLTEEGKIFYNHIKKAIDNINNASLISDQTKVVTVSSTGQSLMCNETVLFITFPIKYKQKQWQESLAAAFWHGFCKA